MHLGEKIKLIRQEKKLKLTDVHKRIKELFGLKALTYRTLQRIQAGENDGKGSSIYQICMGLGVTLKELKEGTDEDKFTIAQLVKKRKNQGRYLYNEKAYSEILTSPGLNFLALQLNLKPSAMTSIEKDPNEENKKFMKWLYVLMGTLTCQIGEKTYTLKKWDSLTIDSTINHYFSNKSEHKVICLIVQIPRHI